MKADNIIADSGTTVGIFNVVVGSIEFGVPDVLTDVLIEEDRVLRNNAKGSRRVACVTERKF